MHSPASNNDKDPYELSVTSEPSVPPPLTLLIQSDNNHKQTETEILTLWPKLRSVEPLKIFRFLENDVAYTLLSKPSQEG